MDLEDLQEALDEVFGPDEYSIEYLEENGEIVIYTGLRENEDGDLISVLDEEDEEDPEADPDFEPLEDEDEDLD